MLTLQDKVYMLRKKIDKLPASRQEFARNLCSQFRMKAMLSEAQAVWVNRLLEMADKPQEAEQKPVVLAVNLSAINELFATAAMNLKTPRVYLRHGDRDFVLSQAGQQARQPGTINVQSRGSFENRDWYGRISLAGNWEPSRLEAPEVLPMLTELASNPLETLKMYGKKYGNCCLCGRELTNSTSIEAGIGPICAAKFGF